MISPGDFLALVQEPGRNEKSDLVKMGTIDPAYNGTVGVTGAKVKFDGESAVSGRGYLPLASYTPVVNHRVLLLRAGNTWVILGKIGV